MCLAACVGCLNEGNHTRPTDSIYIACGQQTILGMPMHVKSRLTGGKVTTTEPHLSKALRHPDPKIFLVCNPDDMHSSTSATGTRPSAQQRLPHNPVLRTACLQTATHAKSCMLAFRYFTWKGLSYFLAQACQLACCVHQAEKKCAAVGKYHTMHLHGHVR